MEPCRPNAAVDMIPNPRYIIKRSEKVFFGKKKNAAPHGYDRAENRTPVC